MVSRSRSSLAYLAALLIAARLLVGVPATINGGPALLFFSANTEEGLSLREAIDRIGDPNHTRVRHLAAKVMRDLSAGPALVHDTIGDWEDGVENSLLVELPRSAHPATLRQAAAWVGLIGDQKAVLAFRPDVRGSDVLVMMVVPGTLQEVRDTLTRHGVHDRTILVEADGCRVYIVADGGEEYAAVAAAALKMNAAMEARPGRSELLAGPTRDEARRRYQEVIRQGRRE